MTQTWFSLKAKDDPVGIYPVEFEIEAVRTALLVVDMQKYGYHPDYALGKLLQREAPEVFHYLFSRLENIVVPNIRRLLSFFRASNLRVIFLCVGPLLRDGSDMTPRRRSRDLERLSKTGINHFFHVGTPEHEILDELRPNSGELVINKNSTSAFTSTGIDQILRNMNIENLVFTGAATNGCVETTARDAADRGYNCYLVDDACATKNQDLHDSTMRNFGLLFGKVITTDEMIKELDALLGRQK
ncbi:MAG: cysteine hydrolase [Deltaproteobacteria bacterium]|nr:cysteine hydrolase [Deltaproteobacteria bacterium]